MRGLMKNTVTGSTALSMFLGFFLIFAFAILLRGFVIYKLWGWFIVPLGMQAVGILHAYGISLFVGVLMPQISGKDGDSKDGSKKIILTPLLFLFFGWLVHLCM